MKIRDIVVGSMVLMGCRSNSEDVNNKIQLPSYLREVSGLTAIDNDRLAMVQDEKGIIFIYDIPSNLIVEEIPMRKDADYEGVAKVGNTFFVLKSDGTIVSVMSNGEENVYETDVLTSKNDTEGICYSEEHNGLLVLCKESAGKGFDKTIKAIYLFDLTTKTYTNEPIITIDLTSFLKKKERKMFKPSSIFVTPDQHLLLTDSKSSSLIKTTMEGEVLEHRHLSLPQPEGVCMTPNGTIWVSSESTSIGFLQQIKL